MTLERLIDSLKNEDIAYSENETVASRSTFKVGGSVRLAIFPSSRQKLVRTLELLRESEIKYEIIGNASNMLFAFGFAELSGCCNCPVVALTAAGSKV